MATRSSPSGTFVLNTGLPNETPDDLRTFKNEVDAAIKIGVGPRVNVTAYPWLAVGDGVTDDTTAVDAAAVYLESARGGTLWFPKGTYIVDAPDPIIGGRPFTTNFTTGVFTSAGNQLANDESITLKNVGGVLPAPLVEGTLYYVRDKSGDTLKLAATLGGAAITLTDDGTGTHHFEVGIITWEGDGMGQTFLKHKAAGSTTFLTFSEAIDVPAGRMQNLTVIGNRSGGANLATYTALYVVGTDCALTDIEVRDCVLVGAYVLGPRFRLLGKSKFIGQADATAGDLGVQFHVGLGGGQSTIGPDCEFYDWGINAVFAGQTNPAFQGLDIAGRYINNHHQLVPTGGGAICIGSNTAGDAAVHKVHDVFIQITNPALTQASGLELNGGVSFSDCVIDLGGIGRVGIGLQQYGHMTGTGGSCSNCTIAGLQIDSGVTECSINNIDLSNGNTAALINNSGNSTNYIGAGVIGIDYANFPVIVGIASDPLVHLAGITGLQVGGNAVLWSHTARGAGNVLQIALNSYVDAAGANIYTSADFATRYRQISGKHIFSVAPSGAAGTSATFVSVLETTAAGNVGFGTSTFGTDAVKNLALADGTAPSTARPAGVAWWRAESHTYYGAVTDTELRFDAKSFHFKGHVNIEDAVNDTWDGVANNSIIWLNVEKTYTGSLQNQGKQAGIRSYIILDPSDDQEDPAGWPTSGAEAHSGFFFLEAKGSHNYNSAQGTHSLMGFSGSGTLTTGYGAIADVQLAGAGTVSGDLTGLHGIFRTSGSASGTVTGAGRGVLGSCTISHAITVTGGVRALSAGFTMTAAATVASVAMIHATTPTITAGSITNLYGLRIEDMSAFGTWVTGSMWNIKSFGAQSINLFEGRGLFGALGPTASANYGSLSVGSGPFDGATAGFYVGPAGGTQFAINAPSGYTGHLINCQVAGVSKLALTAVGNLGVGVILARGTTEGTKRLDLYDGTAPAGTLANGVSLFSASGYLNVLNAAGVGGKVIATSSVNSVSPTAPNRTLTIDIGGVTLYIAAKTTND